MRKRDVATRLNEEKVSFIKNISAKSQQETDTFQCDPKCRGIERCNRGIARRLL